MKLYIVANKLDVCKRLERFAFTYSVEKCTVDQLKYSSDINDGLGLVHLDSVDESSFSEIVDLHPTVKWIALADYPADAQGLVVLEFGYRGYINTYVTESIFSELLIRVNEGDIWAGPSITQALLKQYVGSKSQLSFNGIKALSNSFDLTDREEEVIHQVVEGASNKEVARSLGITERTVKAHMSSILRKTGTTDRVSLILKLTQ